MHTRTVHIRFRLAAACLWTAVSLAAQPQSAEPDSVRLRDIPEVTVTGRNNPESRSTAPLQVVTTDDLGRLNALQVSDAVKHFSGVAVKDYGGVGGLKTVSVRSLGANHTTVNYDGVAVSDVQTGQIDIGRFSLDDVESVSLVNGQSDDIFRPARSFASASVLDIHSRRPVFEHGKRIGGKAFLRGGSFGLLNPSLTLNGKITSWLTSSVSGEYLYTRGNYPFKYRYGNSEGDSVAVLRRQNTDVRNLRLEAALYATPSEQEEASLKAYYYHSERGLPGNVTYYNPQQNTNQRTWDHTFFTQGHYRRQWSHQWSLQASGKYHRSSMRYLDAEYLGSTGVQDNTYSQQEYYGSVSALYRPWSSFSLSASADGFINTMQSDLAGFAEPTRYSLLSVLAAKYANNWLLATASVLNTLVHERVEHGDAPARHCRFSPYASLSFKPFGAHDLRLRMFYKEIFRLPTFNDLYYTNVGNTNLKPETTRQYNVGLTYTDRWGKYIPHVHLTADLYYNSVDNKIVALPSKKDIFLWSMVNYGKVAISGMDLTGEWRIRPTDRIGLLLGASYTYQRALNVTDPTDPYTYRHQIPYTPRVSGSARGGVETPWVNLSYSLVWSGHRYTFTQNYPANRLEGYQDHSLSLSRVFLLSFGKLSASIEALNLGGENYQVVRGFPMPGRSWRATVGLTF